MTDPTGFAEASAIIEGFRGVRVLVLGDLMLDEYLRGDADRVSPEAPVPVVTIVEESSGLGGAANVAAQLVALGVEVELAGVVGDDPAADALRVCCAEQGIGTAAVVGDPGRPTTRKMRVLADRQHVVRLDRESTLPLPEAIEDQLAAALARCAPPDAVVISDYAKGVVSERVVATVTGLAAGWGVPVLVDPKDPDLRRFRGASLVKANEAEFRAAARTVLGVAAPTIDDAPALRAELGLDALVVTLGEQGLVLVEDDQVRLVPTVPAQVYDVSGAGDVVLAVLAAATASGRDRHLACHVGNVAAGISVRRLGISTVGPGELAVALAGEQTAKVLDRRQLADRVAWWRAEGRAVVVTNGCFDLLHPGHLHLLRTAASLGDELVVAVNSDRSVQDLKGPERPVVGERERMALLAALDCVDAVVMFEGDDLEELLGEIRPDVLVKGSDYRPDDVVGRAVVEAAGGRVALVDLLAEHSTTDLVRRIRDTDR